MRLCASAEYPIGHDFNVLKILVRLWLFITALIVVFQLAWGDRPVILEFSSMAILSASMTFLVAAVNRAAIDQIRESISLTGGSNLTNWGVIKLLATPTTLLPA